MTMKTQHLLVLNNLLNVVAANCATTAEGDDRGARAPRAEVATVLSNMAFYGYTPALPALEALQTLTGSRLAEFWDELQPVLAQITGADRNMGDFVVYKNFPQEVLSMSEGQYWFNQILMYLGAPNEWFQEDAEARAPLNDKLKLKVLGLASDVALANIYDALVRAKARWTDAQSEQAVALACALPVSDLDLSDFGFKENGINLIAASLEFDGTVTISDATDVLRLAAAMSDQDVSLQKTLRFRNFTRGERRFLLSLLEASKNLRADLTLRSELWKKLLARLHPGDFKFEKVTATYDALFKGSLLGFNAAVEANLLTKEKLVLEQLQHRPGEFLRRLHALYDVFGMDAVRAFVAIADKLNTTQLLKLHSYLRTVNTRKEFMRAPKGNWAKAQVMANEKKKFSGVALNALFDVINATLFARMDSALPQGVALAHEADYIKLQTNDQELAPYGRGTVFPIPPEMTFIRSASYWECAVGTDVWFDVGFNFFNDYWVDLGACCWSNERLQRGSEVGAVFSGDPTNSKDLKGRACQMIDLYLDKLAAMGVRYAVWNVLAYSRIKFSDAGEVLATLQWGENPEAGNLYEPSRAQMVFPLKGTALTKYVAMLDLKLRQVVYLDANLAGDVSSAVRNGEKLSKHMPAYMEYLKALPSVADMFANAKEGTTPVLYSDAEVPLEKGQKAYVFKSENANNDFEPLKLETML